MEVFEKYRGKLKEEAKERQSQFKGNQYTKVELTPKGGNTKKGKTSKELAKLAKVSPIIICIIPFKILTNQFYKENSH